MTFTRTAVLVSLCENVSFLLTTQLQRWRKLLTYALLIGLAAGFPNRKSFGGQVAAYASQSMLLKAAIKEIRGADAVIASASSVQVTLYGKSGQKVNMSQKTP